MPPAEKLERWNETFSYLGNNANPPDMMLKNGDAIEVKKIESPDAALALNSSYPKQILFSSNPMISSACRDAEIWEAKDILYVVGVVKNNSLKNLCMIYGKNYCASEECYSRIRQRIKTGVETIDGVEFSPTRELGRINRVDPLGITYLRVRDVHNRRGKMAPIRQPRDFDWLKSKFENLRRPHKKSRQSRQINRRQIDSLQNLR